MLSRIKFYYIICFYAVVHYIRDTICVKLYKYETFSTQCSVQYVDPAEYEMMYYIQAVKKKIEETHFKDNLIFL